MKSRSKTQKSMETNGLEREHETGQAIHPQFDELYGRYQNEVFSFAYHLTRNRGDAEDLYQEAWLRIVKKLPKEVDMRGIKAWIFTIVINLHRDELRKKRIRRLFLLEKAKAHEEEEASFPVQQDILPADSKDQGLRTEMGRDIHQALDSLPQRQRRVFVLKEIAGFKQAEISDILGVPVGTVKSLMYRAVKRLRQELSKYKTKYNPKEEIKCDVKTSSA
ncbi:MAG: RNA polymerase sigma factor [Candidatus Aminicenantes bacterium]|nr:RNA polymerase sigma factor [Candidatus Aminicenantes bacterium]